ncbi:transposase family protein [Streptomyces sp. NPDC003996]
MVVTGFKATRARKLTTSENEANRALAAARAPVEHGFGHLKNFTKLRTDPACATGLLRALFVLTNLEGAR